MNIDRKIRKFNRPVKISHPRDKEAFKSLSKREVVFNREFKLKYWLYKGAIHRDYDRPAIVYDDGRKAWYQNGIRHRDTSIRSDGVLIERPAIITQEDFFWYKRGRQHRLSGPAYVYIKFYKCQHGIKYSSWYINNKEYLQFKSDQILHLQRLIRQLYFSKRPPIYAPSNLGGIYVKSQLLELVG